MPADGSLGRLDVRFKVVRAKCGSLDDDELRIRKARAKLNEH